LQRKAFLDKVTIFSCTKRATTGSSFLGLEKVTLAKNLEAESGIGFKKKVESYY
jgi:hypothetical protein